MIGVDEGRYRAERNPQTGDAVVVDHAPPRSRVMGATSDRNALAVALELNKAEAGTTTWPDVAALAVFAIMVVAIVWVVFR